MIQYLFEQNIIMIIFAGLCGLGLLVRLIVTSVYTYLVNESDSPGETKNMMLVHMKKKFEACYKLKIGVNNVDIFVDKNVSQYRFCGILLSTWDNCSGQVLVLNLLLIPISVVFGLVFDCEQNQVFLAGAVGILAGAVLVFVDKSINLSRKKRMLRLNLMDYLENFFKVRLEHPELIELNRKEYIQLTEANKQTEQAILSEKEEHKDEINRRKEARKKKEEERKLQAMKREEEQMKQEEARREEAKRKLEERRLLAAKRREEEIQRMEEEREALEARRAEIKRKATLKQQTSEQKQQKVEEKEKIVHDLEKELNNVEERADMNLLMQGLEEIAAEKEKKQLDKKNSEPISIEAAKKEHIAKENEQKAAIGKIKSQEINVDDEKLIEDVLKEFFA